MRLLGVRNVIAARRTHRYATTKPGMILSASVSRLFDFVDFGLVLCTVPFLRRRAAGHAAEHHFKRILRRRLEDIHAGETRGEGVQAASLPAEGESAGIGKFQTTLLSLAAGRALRALYPHCANLYNLAYLDFVYLHAAAFTYLRQRAKPYLEVVWNHPDVFAAMCSSSDACLILSPHTGFMHTARAVSLSAKRIAQVYSNAEEHGFLELNGVRNPREVEVIPVDEHTLLRLSEIAKTDRAILCAPDSEDPVTGRCDFLNLPLFKLAQYTRIALYFVDYALDEKANLRGFIKGPIRVGANGAEAAAQAFIDFCASSTGRRLVVRPDQRGDLHRSPTAVSHHSSQKAVRTSSGARREAQSR